MANKTINDLTVVTSAAADDLIALWRAANSDTRKITKANFMGGILTGGGTLATGGFTLTLGANSAINGNITGSGTIATGGFTLTVPATGTASLLGTAQTYSALKTFSAGLTFGDDTLSTFDVGTWTPTIGGSSVNPTITYGTREGFYLRINNWAIIQATIQMASITGAGTGNVTVTLPLTAAGFDLLQASHYGVDTGSVNNNLVAACHSGAARCGFGYNVNNAATGDVQHSGVSSGDVFYLAGAYRVQ